MILYFLNKHFADTEKLVWPRTPLETNSNYEELQRIFPENNSFKEDYKILNQEVRALGFNIPPLVNSYMSLSPTMRMFGTAINDEFGDVEESGILIAIDEILTNSKTAISSKKVKVCKRSLQTFFLSFKKSVLHTLLCLFAIHRK